MLKNVIALVLLAVSSISSAQSAAGSWYGTLDIQGTKIKLVFHIESVDGFYRTSMDSPDQGVKGMKTDTTIVEGDSIAITINNIAVEYRGYVAPAGGRIDGIFTQNGFSFPLNLSTEAVSLEDLLRPQDPRDFPYFSENVVFKSNAEGVELAGTITMPYEGDVKQAVVLVTGSGPQNRDSEMLIYNHRPFLVLSDFFTRNGIAVLRYDDRGVGGSSGKYALSTINDFTEDAKGAIQYLRSRADLQGVQVGMVGHSEGGIITPRCSDLLDFMVLMSAPGTSIPETLLEQSRMVNKASGVQDSILDANDIVMAKLYGYVIEHGIQEDSLLLSNLTQIFKNNAGLYPQKTKEEMGDLDAYAQSILAPMLSPWFRDFLTIIPYNAIREVKIPVLAINGTLDMQVPYSSNLSSIEEALKDGGNDSYQIIAMEGLNHLFQSAITGSPGEYGVISETVNEEAMRTMSEWIKKQ